MLEKLRAIARIAGSLHESLEGVNKEQAQRIKDMAESCLTENGKDLLTEKLCGHSEMGVSNVQEGKDIRNENSGI